ncbi:MAG: Rne/Rng family ribonuclease [Burkholderiaceae bacterium]|nr:Rne/Rng family ribonuclease [Burkholderiaceae bacterium]
MKRMLFNATQQEELRVAIVDGQRLIDIDIETAGREQRKSNIYKGVITRIEPSLEACFVNYGEERHGFLPFKEVARSYFREGIDVRNATIKDALREGQEIMVQVEKEERGNKGAALTSFISLAGRYLVLMPNNPRGGGVSRRVEGEDRQELRETMDKLDLPTGMSVIARTAGIGRSVDELQWDLNYLMQLWRAIEGAGQSASGAFLIYQESSLVIRAIRDYFQPDIGEILIDTDDIYEQAQQFMTHVMPDMVHRVKRYRDDVPLFSRFQIEHQIETAYSRTVPLPSGGAIVIDHTEALVSVDVNSARATRGGDIETTAFNTNCEAADEVARQLRLRDLGGLIVIDFIDMENSKNQREVENRLKDALHYDRARVQMGKISRFGLMELSRQRLRPSLSEGSHVNCPRCNGTGHIRDTESSALQILRIIQEEAMKENSAAIHVQVPVDVAAFLLNEKRGEILKIETRHRVTIILIPNKHLETPHYKLERIKHDDPRLDEGQASYAMAEKADTDISYGKRQKEEVRARQEAVVKGITPDQPAPIVERKEPEAAPVVAAPKQGFFAWLTGLFGAKEAAPAAAPVAVEAKPATQRERGERGGRGRNRNRGGRGRERGEDKDGAREGKGEGTRENAREEQQAKEPRQPKQREQRQPREARENTEARTDATAETRNEGRNESREGRNEGRQGRGEGRGEGQGRRERNRPAREEREEVAAEAKAEDLLTSAAVTDTGAEAPAQETAAEAGEGKERRRRRRGGRNRNRRDREAGETAETGDNVEAGFDGEAGDAAAADVVAEQVAADSAAIQHAAVEAPVATHVQQAAPVAVVEAAIVVETIVEAVVAPAVPVQPAVPYQQDLLAAAQEAPVEVVAAAVVEEAAVAPAAPAVVVEAPVAPAVSVAPAAPIKVEAPAVDLTSVLSAAGLTLASTNPDKLRAAQEAAAKIVAAPHVPRERKPLPALSNEPLVQVETRR